MPGQAIEAAKDSGLSFAAVASVVAGADRVDTFLAAAPLILTAILLVLRIFYTLLQIWKTARGPADE